MKFRVSRTSGLGSATAPCPCDGAVKEGLDWTVEIAGMDSLIDLVNNAKHEVIISTLWGDSPELEIYDTYRE